MSLKSLKKALGEDWVLDQDLPSENYRSYNRNADGLLLRIFNHDQAYCWDVYCDTEGHMPAARYYGAKSIQEAKDLCDEWYPEGTDPKSWLEYPDRFVKDV